MITFHQYVVKAKQLRPNAGKTELNLVVRLLYIKTIADNLLRY